MIHKIDICKSSTKVFEVSSIKVSTNQIFLFLRNAAVGPDGKERFRLRRSRYAEDHTLEKVYENRDEEWKDLIVYAAVKMLKGIDPYIFFLFCSLGSFD